MKKIGFVLLLMVLTTFVFAQGAVLREVTGTVELKAPGADWVNARAGDRIQRETIVSTGFRSSAVIAVGSSTITVRPLTRLSFETILSMEASETVNVELNTGRIRVEVRPPAGTRSDFNVQSPMVTASVRGTIFDIDTLRIFVREGAVRFESAVSDLGNPVLVIANQSSWLDTDTGIPLNTLDAAALSRSLPMLPGMEALPLIAGGGVTSAFGDIDVGVNLTNTNGTIDIGTSLSGNRGNFEVDVNLTK